MNLSHGAVGWSAVYDFVVFPYHTHFFLQSRFIFLNTLETHHFNIHCFFYKNSLSMLFILPHMSHDLPKMGFAHALHSDVTTTLVFFQQLWSDGWDFNSI